MEESNNDNNTLTGWQKDSGWRRYIPSWIWNEIQITDPRPFIGWELNDEGMPWFVMKEFVRGVGAIESMGIVKAWDDSATGLFHQRDWTSSGTPFVTEGETYWSGWWFQFREDAEKFLELHDLHVVFIDSVLQK